MNYIKIIGLIASILGAIVLVVAAYLSFNAEKVHLEPFLLGIAAVSAGLICIKKSREE